MGSGAYIRRFTFDPGPEVLLNIESVNIIDQDPPPQVAGVPFGRAMIVGEFEDGPYNTPTLVTSQDLAQTFGAASLGFTYNGVVGQNPCARKRSADGASTPEFWNGNAFLHLSGKTFGSLVVVRADTSVGEVSLTRAASQTSATVGPWNINGIGAPRTLVVNNGAASTTCTFTGAVAALAGSGGTYPTLFAGGEKMSISVEGNPAVEITFLASDQSLVQVCARINAAMGYTCAAPNAGQLTLAGFVPGTLSRLLITAADASVVTALGLSGFVGFLVSGTGNTSNLQAVTVADLDSVINAATTGAFRCEAAPSGAARIYNTAGLDCIIKSTSTANAPFGFLLENTSAQSGDALAGTIPAGTVLKASGSGQKFVTCRSTTVTTAAGPYTIRVRHATDDQTGTSQAAGTINLLDSPLVTGAFTVTNLLSVSATLSEEAIDSAYDAAIDSTLDINGPAKQVNFFWSARQSNEIRRKLKANAIFASARGFFGRQVMIRPPMNTLKNRATSALVEPGVGMYRDERTIYNYPGFSIRNAQIATIGTAGGAGFTADGVIDVGSDGFCASILSQLPAGENPAQETSFLANVVGLESGANVKGFDMDDYIAFKAAGIMAPRIDDGEAVFQSGVNSLNPATYPTKVDIERRTLADYIEDSIAVFFKPYVKKKMTIPRQIALLQAVNSFMTGLTGDENGNGARVSAFSVTPAADADGLLRKSGRYRLNLKAVQTPSFKSIELAATVGPTVEIDEG